MVPWGLYGASDGSLPGRGGSDAALLRSFLAWHWKRNRKEMASTTIARKGFVGLYFLSIDGLAEAGELRGSLDAGRGMGIIVLPSRLGFEWRLLASGGMNSRRV